jgi:hypothetical protein
MRSRAILLLAMMASALVVASGVAWAAQISCPNRAGNLCVGTNNSDTMTGRDRSDEMRANDGSDEMRGLGGADELLGQAGNDTALGQDGPDILAGGRGKDTLSGAKAKDRLAGAEGDDALNGGDADDTYAFNINSWGDDTITDSTIADDDPLTTGNFAEFGFPEPLTTSVTVNLTTSVSSPEVSNGTLTGTVNWSNNAIGGVYVGTTQDDTVRGNGLANQMNVKGEDVSGDDVFGGAGNDRISVMDGDGGDFVDCGEDGVGVDTDDDTVFLDAGDTQVNCES